MLFRSESVAPDTDPSKYLAAVRAKVEARRAFYDANPTSDDGWNDEDGYILGGIRPVLNAIDEQEARLR